MKHVRVKTVTMTLILDVTTNEMACFYCLGLNYLIMAYKYNQISLNMNSKSYWTGE